MKETYCNFQVRHPHCVSYDLHQFLLTICYFYTAMGILNDYRWNAVATTANLHWPYREYLTFLNVTTKYQQQIFQQTRKATLLLCLILNM